MAAEALAKQRREDRDLRPRVLDDTGLWEVVSPHGGRPPMPLQGVYTSEAYAIKAIEKYAATGS